MRIQTLLTAAVLLAHILQAQTQALTYAERLGWKRGDRVVILHVDDAGMSHDSNEGTRMALEQGIANSFSVMMTCPWVPEIVRYIKAHPTVDAGLHLTLTSEWQSYRWEPLVSAENAPGLVDAEGALWRSVQEVAQHATADEVEREIRAQLQRARRMGFTPTHLDSHMGTLFATPQFMERYIKLGAEQQIPVMFPGGHNALLAEQYRDEAIARLKRQQQWREGQTLPEAPEMDQARKAGEQVWSLGLPVLDDLHNVSYGWTLPAGVEATDENLRALKVKKYAEAFHKLRPGVTMVIMHCTNPSATFASISPSGPTRKGDLLAMMSPELRQALQQEGLILTTWRELQQRRKNVAVRP